MEWLDLLAVQVTLKSLFQHHSSKASILQCSAFFIVSANLLSCFSHARLCATLWTAACQASLSLTISWSLPKFMLIASVMLSSHLILWHPLLLLSLIFPSIRDFSNELSVHIRWPKYWNFSFSISLSIEYSGFISLKIDWFDLLAVQGTFRSLL